MNAVRGDIDAPVREFNSRQDPAARVDPFTALDRFRGDPVFWTSEMGGLWVLTRYADIRAVLRDPKTFSSMNTSNKPAGLSQRLIPVELDPPEHGGYRTILVRSLAGPAGVTITQALAGACASLVTALAPRGSCDFVADFAQPLRNTLFAALFDLPEPDTGLGARLASDLFQATDPDVRARAVQDFMAYLQREIAARASGPNSGTGLLDVLARADVNGRHLRTEEATNLGFVMALGSLDTVANSISFSFRYLADKPDLQQRLATEPEVAARAAEELLRMHSVVTVARVATRDTDIAGVRIRAGERLLLNTAMAGRDPNQYPEPTTADFDRPNRASHLAFGYGVHRCLGARVATKALITALREWHAAIPSYTLADATTPSAAGGVVCSLDSLPLTWLDHSSTRIG